MFAWRNAFPFTNVTEAGANLYFKDKFVAFQLIDNWSFVADLIEKSVFILRIYNGRVYFFNIFFKYNYFSAIKWLILIAFSSIFMDMHGEKSALNPIRLKSLVFFKVRLVSELVWSFSPDTSENSMIVLHD